GRALRRGGPDRARRAAAGAAAPAARAAQDERVRHPGRRRGLPPRGPGGDPQTGRDHRAGRHAAGDPRRPGRRLRRELRGGGPRRPHPARRTGRRPRRGGGRRGAARRGARRGHGRRAGGGAGPVTWVRENLDVIAAYTGAHLLQALPPILVAFALSLPLAKLANSRGWLRTGVTTTSGLMYAIPSLPLFVLLPGLVGTGVRSPLNIAVALSLYGLALMVPPAPAACRPLPPGRAAARGAGAAGRGAGGRGEHHLAGHRRRRARRAEPGDAVRGRRAPRHRRGDRRGHRRHRRPRPAHRCAAGAAGTRRDALDPTAGGAQTMTGNPFLDSLDWLGDPLRWSGPDGIPLRTLEHLGYTALGVLVAALLAVPIGLYVGHTGR